MESEKQQDPNMHCLACGLDFYFAGYGTAGTWCPECSKKGQPGNVVSKFFADYVGAYK